MKLLKELTGRERDVLEILLKGRLDKEIACELGISVETIKKHNKNIYKKLDARNRGEVIALMSTLEVNNFFRTNQRKH